MTTQTTENARQRPANLQKNGALFWQETLNNYELDARDIPILTEICSTLDEIDQLKAAIRVDGGITRGSEGQPREHPALGGLRAHRLVLDKLMVRLGLPSSAGVAPLSDLQMRAKAAAEARWAGHRKGSA